MTTLSFSLILSYIVLIMIIIFYMFLYYKERQKNKNNYEIHKKEKQGLLKRIESLSNECTKLKTDVNTNKSKVETYKDIESNQSLLQEMYKNIITAIIKTISSPIVAYHDSYQYHSFTVKKEKGVSINKIENKRKVSFPATLGYALPNGFLSKVHMKEQLEELNRKLHTPTKLDVNKIFTPTKF